MPARETVAEDSVPARRYKASPGASIAPGAHSDFLAYYSDGLSAKYYGRGNHLMDVGTARGDSSFSLLLLHTGRIGYFEMEIASPGNGRCFPFSYAVIMGSTLFCFF